MGPLIRVGCTRTDTTAGQPGAARAENPTLSRGRSWTSECHVRDGLRPGGFPRALLIMEDLDDRDRVSDLRRRPGRAVVSALAASRPQTVIENAFGRN